jgi:hypothetical protein
MAEQDLGADQGFRQAAADATRRQRARDRARGVDAAIEEAIARGDFSNLPGAGKPLNWDTPYDDADWLAGHMLKSAGYRPAWVEELGAIQAERAAIEGALRALDAPGLGASAVERQAAALEGRAAALNERIARFNLAVPLAERQQPRLEVAAALAAARGRPAG